MRIVNRTALEQSWLERIFHTVAPRGLDDDTDLIFEHVDDQTGSGLAWARNTKFHGNVPKAYVYVPRAPRFPLYPPAVKNRHGFRGYTVELRTLEECLVYVVAHELAHLRYGPSERPAHWWGMKMLLRYRRRAWAPVVERVAAEH